MSKTLIYKEDDRDIIDWEPTVEAIKKASRKPTPLALNRQGRVLGIFRIVKKE